MVVVVVEEEEEPGARNFGLMRELPCSKVVQFNSACGANYPYQYQALKGGYFLFVWRALT